ncbi:MAG: PEP-CTERM sorting domain-containing protein [Verrucomicrobia bacterium]|nr:PEP-CTERM sorting domain-containing protein [Verrucomicrobiota bacterium]
MRRLLLIVVMLVFPMVASAYVAVDTDFENAALGALDGQVFDGGAWSCPWWNNQQVSIIDVETLFAGRGQVAAFVSTAPGATSTAVCTRTDGIVPPAVDFYGDPAYLNGTTIFEFDYYAASNAGDWTNFGAFYGKGMWRYLEPTTNTIELWDQSGPAGWDYANKLTFGAGPIPLDQWFSVRIEYTNMSDGGGNPISGTYDYYVNGVLVGDDIAGDWPGEPYLEWNFILNDMFLDPETEGIGYLMIDKVKWSYEAVPEPSMLLLSGLGLLALLRRMK